MQKLNMSLASKLPKLFACLMILASSTSFADGSDKGCEVEAVLGERAQKLTELLNSADELWITFRDPTGRQARIRVAIGPDSVRNGNLGDRKGQVFFSPAIDPSDVTRSCGVPSDDSKAPIHYHIMRDHVVGIHEHTWYKPTPLELAERELLTPEKWHIAEVSLGLTGTFALGPYFKKTNSPKQLFVSVTLSRGEHPERVFVYGDESYYQVVEIDVFVPPTPTRAFGGPLRSNQRAMVNIFREGRYTLFDEASAP